MINVNLQLSESCQAAVRAITQIVCDPENQPHQWMGEAELLENMILAALAQAELVKTEFTSGNSTSESYNLAVGVM